MRLQGCRLELQAPVRPLPTLQFRDLAQFEEHIAAIRPKKRYHQNSAAKCILPAYFYMKGKTRAAMRSTYAGSSDTADLTDGGMQVAAGDTAVLAVRQYFAPGSDAKKMTQYTAAFRVTSVVWNFYILKNNLIQLLEKKEERLVRPLFRSVESVVLCQRRLEILYDHELLSEDFKAYLVGCIAQQDAQQVMKRLAVQLDIAKQMMPVITKAMLYADTVFQRRQIRRHKEEIDGVEHRKKALFETELAD